MAKASYSENSKRILYVDILNIIAILMVLFLHHSGTGIFTYQDSQAWKTSMIIECIFYSAVPIFVMLTGVTLLDYHKKYDTKTYFKKRVLKVVIPLIFWLLLMYIWHAFIIKDLSTSNWSITKFLNDLLSCKVEPTYYFLFAIIGVYLTIPVLSHLTEKKNRKLLYYAIITFFIVNSLLPNAKLLGINISSDLRFLITGYMIYVLLGYVLSQITIPKKYRIVLYLSAILGCVFQYATTLVLSKSAGRLVQDSWGYFQFYTILEACAVFVFFKQFSTCHLLNNPRASHIFSTLAKCSFGIYLIHKIIIYYELKLTGMSQFSWQWRVLMVFCTYTISLAIIYILKKIPLARKTVP
ncbi:acyltransferase [Candidatus Saccharibacteria bacterium]|nr:acyltransferase [Candidatus Saccharibacteria bacterium]